MEVTITHDGSFDYENMSLDTLIDLARQATIEEADKAYDYNVFCCHYDEHIATDDDKKTLYHLLSIRNQMLNNKEVVMYWMNRKFYKLQQERRQAFLTQQQQLKTTRETK